MNNQTSREKVLTCVNIIVKKGGEVLLGRRMKSGKGAWCNPGGHLEHGESAIEAAKRELYEETGIEAKDITFVHVLNDPHCDGYHYVTLNFLVTSWIGEPSVLEPDKFYEWRWFSIDNLPSPMFSHHGVLIEMLRKNVIFQDNA